MAKDQESAEVKEKPVKEKSQNIYSKMAVVKTKLLGIKKGGKNEFSHYNYFELGDILPVLTPALQEERLYMQTQFSATEQTAKLVIIDIDNTESKIEFECKFAECALKGAHEIQNLGAAQTYTRRYLIMTAFDVAEADVVDAGAEKDEKKEAFKKAEQEAKNRQNKKPPVNPPQQETEQKPLDILRRETWETIKKLPQENQAVWVDSCKGADRNTLLEIIAGVNQELSAIENSKGSEGETPEQDQGAATEKPLSEKELDIF